MDAHEELREVCNLYLVIDAVDPSDPIIKEFADQDRISLMLHKYLSCDVLPQYKISYGKLLYDNQGVNQVDWVIERLRAKPETKSATIGLHQPGQSELSCLSLLDFKLRAGALSITAVYRSQNVFASQPGNVLAIRQVQEHVADALSVPSGPFHLVVMSGHIYGHDEDRARLVVEKAPED